MRWGEMTLGEISNQALLSLKKSNRGALWQQRDWRRRSFKKEALACLTLAVSFAPIARAQTAVNLDLGSVTAQGAGTLAQTPGTAPYEAPSIAPMNATQPTSAISQQSIQNNFGSTASYSDIVKLSPSVSGTDPNGPGLMESQVLSIRGFQDGQYNVTFDGIPLVETAPGGDPNDFAHHTTSYFMDNDIGGIDVDRGPGTASTIGNATFGGTIAVQTKNPLAQLTLTPSATYGSFNTGLEGAEIDTGAFGPDGATAVLDFEHLKSSGYLTNAGQERGNFFSKFIVPLSPNTVLTFMAMINRTFQHTTLGQTAEQIATLGANYGLSSDPTSQAYTGYNTDRINSDIEYAGITSNFLPGWSLDTKLYSYGYDYDGHNGEDPNGDSPNGTVTQDAAGDFITNDNDVPGQNLRNAYRSYGVIARFTRAFGLGDVKFGVWFDHQRNRRTLTEIDLSKGGVYNYGGSGDDGDDGADDGGDSNDSGDGPVSPLDLLLKNETNTLQPYVQFDLTPLPGLTLIPGLKYAYYVRNFNDPVNNDVGEPVGYIRAYHSLLPSFEARYQFTQALSAYAQVAEGYLGPNRNTLYTQSGYDPDLTPETTWNYQTGFAYQTAKLALDADLYLVHFNALIQSHTAGPTTIFYNSGGAVYKGVEGEATYLLPRGFSVFANGSVNDAETTSTHTPLAETPQLTGNAGLIYDKDNIYAAVIDQYTGGHYDNNDLAAGNVPGQWYDPYNLVGVSLAYNVVGPNPHLPHVRLKFDIENLTDQRQIFDSVGTAVDGVTPLYFTLPGRSLFGSVSVPIS
jgi:iron complex outermembrane receptor protein